MKHKYTIDRKSTQFVDDHIHIRGEIFRNISNFAILQAEYF